MKSRIDQFAYAWAEFVIRWRFVVIALSFVAVFAGASGVTNLKFANDYRVFFSKDNPDLKAFEAFQNTYTKTDNVLFVIKPEDGTVFNSTVMAAVEEITKEASDCNTQRAGSSVFLLSTPMSRKIG